MKSRTTPKRRKVTKVAKSSKHKDNELVGKLSLRQLARRLHDGPIQAVAALAMQADLANRLLNRDPAATAAELTKLEELARRTTRELRHLQFTLRPQSLESAGLTAALGDLAAHDNELYGNAVNIEIEKGVDARLNDPQKEHLFHIAADAISNARKYGLATKIEVSLKLAGSEPTLEIRDNGTGFDLKKEDINNYGDLGLGLELMRRRTRLIGGRLKIETQTGLGTVVRVTVPVK